MFRETLRSIMARAAAFIGALIPIRRRAPLAVRANWATLRAREDRTSLRAFQGRELAELAQQSVRETVPASNWQQFLTLRGAPVWSTPRGGSLQAILTARAGQPYAEAANEDLYDLFGQSAGRHDVVVPMTRRTAAGSQGSASA